MILGRRRESTESKLNVTSDIHTVAAHSRPPVSNGWNMDRGNPKNVAVLRLIAVVDIVVKAPAVVYLAYNYCRPMNFGGRMLGCELK